MGSSAEIKAFVEKIDFFSGLDRKLQERVAKAALLRSYPPGAVIVRQGEVGLGLYAILHGRVKVERDQNGVPLQIAELGSQQFFAEISMVDNKPRSATITTLEDTECMLLTRDSFLKLVKSYPELALRLARVLAERLRAADEKLDPQRVPPVPHAPVAEAPAPSAATPSTLPAPETPGKLKVQASLLDTFRSLYAMKAMVRFSVAVLGCPVEGHSPSIAGEIRVGEAKAILLPADEPVELNILASESGEFTLHVFAPGAESAVGYGPLAIQPCDLFQLRIEDGSLTLWSSGEIVASSAGCA